ncbi:putative porin [Spongiimicrobium salis]|uniref:putative porin n=1 Tax=Spongiimicrobium salis TaxID=1667022 RepID=UPI00374D1C42
MKYTLLLLFVFATHALFAQEEEPPVPPKQGQDSILKKAQPLGKRKAKAKDDITIKDYKIISYERDTVALDTSISIQKEYKFNFLRKDDFEWQSFSNIGQAYNRLGANFERRNIYPILGAKAKHFNYQEIEDVKYYNVATPLSDLMFKTTLEEGQLLDALLTFNTSERLNFSIGFKGFRSLGKFQDNQAESGNFKTTVNYVTKDARYNIRAHIAAQNTESEENGGLANREQFESGDEDFRDRARIDLVFDDANNRVLGKRYFLDHNYKLLRKERDSGVARQTEITLGHQFNYETKFYQFRQEQQNDFFGESFLNAIDDKATLKTAYNQVNAEFFNTTLGRLKGSVALYNYDYFFNSILITDSQQIDNQLRGEEIVVGGEYQKKIGGFQLEGGIQYNVSGNLTGNLIDAAASYRINDKHQLRFGIHSSSRTPDFNFLLYQSDYENYNWQNTEVFENERINSLEFDLLSKRWGNLAIKYSTLDNHTYFTPDSNVATQEQIDSGLENAFVRPFQETNSVNYLKVKYEKEFKVGKFALNNTILYQNVSQTNQVLNLPDLVTRNTLYFSSDIFKKAMFIQTGVTFKYFTSYNADGYNPLLGEFFTQNTEEIGGFPLLDFFINARVRQTRIFLKAEHFNSPFSNNNFYASPNYPYRDFVIRFGLVWNFFS